MSIFTDSSGCLRGPLQLAIVFVVWLAALFALFRPFLPVFGVSADFPFGSADGRTSVQYETVSDDATNHRSDAGNLPRSGRGER